MNFRRIFGEFSVAEAADRTFQQKNNLQKHTFQILPLLLPLQKALERGVIAQKRIHHKTRAEAEAVDEGVQLAFAHKLCVGVAEAEEQGLVFASELLGKLFLEMVLTVYYA